ncbi:MAG: MarR family transcriptional regulator [Deltaproteobacteria bacterium]|nr:MarR family transcriptional regulator [Deltaproteobacteria bacterium]
MINSHMGRDSVTGYAEKIYVLIHHCHEECLKLARLKAPGNEFSELGLGITAGLVLKLLLDAGGMTQKELTRKLGITSSSCGQVIAGLEVGKYLTRVAYPGDRRTFGLRLTKRGQALGKKYKEASVVALEEWASDLTGREKEKLHGLLVKLHGGLVRRSAG